MLTFLALLQDWIPYTLAILYIVLHHGIMGALWPEEVFNHAAAINAPWTWAGIHACFILCSCAGNIIAWRFNEQSLDRMKHQAAELEEANKLQADFTAMIAHDLRAPISTVLNTAEVMENGIFGTISQEQQEWLGKMQKTCRAVLEIVSDFLDISKIEAGRLDLIKERIDLYKLIQGSLESYVPMATVKNIASPRVSFSLTEVECGQISSSPLSLGRLEVESEIGKGSASLLQLLTNSGPVISRPSPPKKWTTASARSTKSQSGSHPTTGWHRPVWSIHAHHII